MFFTVDVDDIKLSSKLGVLTRPDGSAMFCQGETVMISGIYGPAEVKAQKILIDKATVEAHYKPKAGLSSIKDRVKESVIRNTCESALVTTLYPRSAITVIVQEMHDNGDALSCAINASMLALMDTGIDLKFLIAAVSCNLDVNETLHLHSTKAEGAIAKFLFVFDSIDKRVIAAHAEGSFKNDQFQEALELCKEHSKHVFEFLKKSVSL